jgi:predicted nuclease of predicted toxin-antitoxin system
VKLLLDEHYPNEIASELRAAGHDVATVSERHLNSTGDEQLLVIASTEDRAMLTNNARDFLPIVSRWATSGRDHCGLLLTDDKSMPRTKGNIGSFIRTLAALMRANPQARALENQVRWI